VSVSSSVLEGRWATPARDTGNLNQFFSRLVIFHQTFCQFKRVEKKFDDSSYTCVDLHHVQSVPDIYKYLHTSMYSREAILHVLVRVVVLL